MSHCKCVVVARERLTNDQESAYGRHQLVHRPMPMVARDGTVRPRAWGAMPLLAALVHDSTESNAEL